jgi:hypothetical protein
MGHIIMENLIRITIEHLVNGKIIETNVTLKQSVSKPKNISELGFNHQHALSRF